MGFTMRHDCFLCLKNYIHSTVQQFLYVVWCFNTSTHIILCLRCYATFEGVLQESSPKIH